MINTKGKRMKKINKSLIASAIALSFTAGNMNVVFAAQSNEEKNEIEGWLIVQIGSGDSNSQYIGSQTFASATLYGNSAYGSANSMAMYSYSRQQGYSIVMYDMHSKHKAFIMEASTSASGLANITNSVFAKSLAGKIISEMESNGFLN